MSCSKRCAMKRATFRRPGNCLWNRDNGWISLENSMVATRVGDLRRSMRCGHRNKQRLPRRKAALQSRELYLLPDTSLPRMCSYAGVDDKLQAGEGEHLALGRLFI